MNERGSGVVEASLITIFLTAFVSLALSAAYLVFAKYFIQYESEQALYCALQNALTNRCQNESETRLHHFLPWGKVTVRIFGLKRTWMVSVSFEWEQIKWISNKTLTEKNLVARRALHW